MQNSGELVDSEGAESAPSESSGAPECKPQYGFSIAHAAAVQLALDALAALKTGDVTACEGLLAQLVDHLADPEG